MLNGNLSHDVAGRTAVTRETDPVPHSPSRRPNILLITLDQFRSQNEEYAMANGIYQDAMTQSTSVQVSDDAVHELLGKLADDAGLELGAELSAASTSKVEPVKESAEPTAEQEDALQQRLRALRA